MKSFFSKLRDRLSPPGWPRFLMLALVLVIFVVAEPALFSRAGGGGGGRSGGGGSSRSWSSSSSSYSGGSGGSMSWEGFLVCVAIFLIVSFISGKKKREGTKYNNIPASSGESRAKKRKSYENFLRTNPGFNEERFKEKVKSAFMKIQHAWQEQELSPVRRFISDGVYQRFNTQFKMMQLLDQKNLIDNLKVNRIAVDKVESDGLFDILHVEISASIVDRFVSTKFRGLNNGGAETFVEYWSFIRKRGAVEKDIYSSMNCPQCGAELPADGGELARCPFCETITNSGEYDWVLSEITQADDYAFSSPRLLKSNSLNSRIKELVDENDDFSVQLLEDKASNGYLQILTAITLKKPELMRRFVSDGAFNMLKGRIGNREIVYNRLYLNDVSLIGLTRVGDKNNLAVAVTSSYQRIELNGERYSRLDSVVTTGTEIILMSRDVGAGLPKGSLYAHCCPNCGSPVGDTIDLRCQACSSELNSTAHEWIITNVMSKAQYQNFLEANKLNIHYNVKPELLDSLYSVRDYAFNNLLILIAADGKFDRAEWDFAERIARKWGYSPKKIRSLFEMAKNGRISLRMPDNREQVKKIYRLMERGAMADGSISNEERQILDDIKGSYLNS